jgi:hypothetical protein
VKQLLAILILTAAANARPDKAISHYMQDAGLLYLETVESLSLECGQTSTADSDCLKNWHTELYGIEDRITIHMTKTRANTQYFDMLKSARWMRENWATGDKDQQKEWGPKYSKCVAYLHTIALNGDIFGSERVCE